MQNMCIYIYIHAHTHTHARIHRHTDTHAGVIQSCWLSGCWRCWGVNLYLVALSGCLRGRLIKGNEMLWGLFSTDSYWTVHSFMSPAQGVGTTLPHSGSWLNKARQTGPLSWYTCKRGHAGVSVPGNLKKKKFISKTKSVTTVDDWSSDIFGWW